MPTKKRRNTKFDEKLYVKCFALAQAGQTDRGIAIACGVDYHTLKKWRRIYPALDSAIVEGREARSDNGTNSFHDYVYRRLPPYIQALWDDINRWDEEENGVLKIEAMLEKNGMKARQHLFLHAFVASGFCASEACRMVNITRKCFHGWIECDPYFAELVDEMNWHKKNFFESALVRLVKQGDSAAVIFANRTQNRDRGYAEKQTIEHQGAITHDVRQVTMSVDELNLPIEQRKQILEAVRAKRIAHTQQETLHSLKELQTSQTPTVAEVVAEQYEMAKEDVEFDEEWDMMVNSH